MAPTTRARTPSTVPLRDSTNPAPKARKVSHKGARNKGRRGENEIVDILTANGIPSQRVIASGSFVGAKADIKIGVTLNPDGTFPDKDESQCVMRGEVKNRADNPEHLHEAIDEGFVEGMVMIPGKRPGVEALWDYLNQDKVTKCVVLRRGKVPQGAVKNEDWDQVAMICMGAKTFCELFKKAYGDRLPKQTASKVHQD